jgi:tetratricopeptide (TPR) repeat protein
MILGLVVYALSGPAQAQQSEPAEPPEATMPPAAERSSSLAAERFAEGTTLFKQWRFDEAEQRFREALTYRDHPLIHLYLSRALEKQGRLVEAHEALQPALRPGAEPLPPEDVQVAEDLQKSLESRLAQIEVHCDVPGAEVFLDGEHWFTAPGRPRRMIGAGQHVLMARKPGYFPVAEPVSLIPGKQTRVVLRMTADVVQVERRWQPWQPWAVAGTGIAMSLAGGLLRRQAANDYTSFKDALDACQQEPPCQFVPTRRFDSGVWKERAGTGALLIGGSVLAAGLAGVLFNQPRVQRSEPAEDMEYEILPMAAGDTAGISVRIQF